MTELVAPTDHEIKDELDILREFVRDYVQGVKDKIPNQVLDYLEAQIKKILIRLKQGGY